MFSGGSAMWRGWKIIRLLREPMLESVLVVDQLEGRGKKWTDTVKAYLRRRGLDVRQLRRMVQGRSEWWGFVRGNAWSVARGINP